MNIPAWVWAWVGTLVLGLIAGKYSLKKLYGFIKTVDEFIDIPLKLIESYEDDKKITPKEWREIEIQINEFKLELARLRGGV